MRDTHGRYSDVKAIVDLGPDWARGCKDCKFGIVAAPDIVPALPLHESRAVQANEDMILFCDCRAGFMYRQCLRRIYSSMSMESRQNIRAIVMAATTPTVHGEPA